MLRLPEIKDYYSKPACTLLENNHSNYSQVRNENTQKSRINTGHLVNLNELLS